MGLDATGITGGGVEERNNLENGRAVVLDVEIARIRLVVEVLEGGGGGGETTRVADGGGLGGLSSSSSLIESTRRREGRRPVARAGWTGASGSDLSVKGVGRPR